MSHELVDYLAAVCAAQDETSAITAAVAKATELLAADAGAVLRGGRLRGTPGFDPAGTAHATARLGAEIDGALLVGRAAAPLDPREQQLLQAMAQCLGLALQNIALLTAERRTRAERLALLESLREARHDPLTGLPTRALFLEKAARTRGCLLLIDLDRFQAVNDSLGHRAGDDLLVHVAGRLRDCLRPQDTAARLGGDEFAALLADVTVDQAVPFAEQLIDALRQPFRIAGRDVFIGASIGIAAGAGLEPAELLGNADVARHRAKRDGPGRVVVFEPHLHAEALARFTLDGDLQRALRLDQFRLQYQPLFRLGSGAATGVEALVRWQKPERGFVAPGEFVPMAEETGLISDIGRWVLFTAGEQTARWRHRMPGLTLNVNVSGRQLVDPRFAGDVQAMLARSGLPAGAVTLELTESVLMSDPRTAIACLHDLRDLGVAVSVDDFGTGYSSLSYLQSLPIDELKIDRAFLSRAEPTREDLAVVGAVVEMARTLKLRTVIEGIETEAQRRDMRRLGLDLGQGYHLCRPLHPEDVLPALLPA